MTGLLPLGGVTAGALAWVGMAVVESTIVVVACRRLLGISLGTSTTVPPLIFAVGYAAGAGAGHLVHGWLASSVLAAVAALATAAGLSSIVALQPLRSLLQEARGPALQRDLVGAAQA
jgi:hypothetical protein